ncbi:MAG: esterase family protein [Treponema sp.]|jgi:putative tributyrin esterase|nr:esterase family protein [Treponema sp.]
MARFLCNFISYTLRRAVDITVVVPSVTIPESMGVGAPSGAPAKCRHTKADKYPVLYLLHGYGNNHATWNGYTRIELFAEEHNIAVVMFSAENKFYVNHGNDDNYYDFIQNELPDFVLGMFPVSSRPADTYIAGLSMGGFGSLAHAFSNPEKYAAVGAFSAAVSLDVTHVQDLYKSLSALYDPLINAKKRREEGRKLPKIFITCGEKDFLYEANVKFKDDLIALGEDLTWESLPGYGHEWRFWDLQAEKFLGWIPRTDSFVNSGKRQV